MKKLGMFLALALVMAVVMPSCKSSSPLEKARKNQAKNKLAELKKEGWTVYGSAKTLEVELLEFYDALDKEGAKQMVGVASSFISKNVGKQTALNSACNEYAREAQSFVRGRVVSDMFNNADDVPAEFDKFYAAYESIVAKEIKGELTHKFSIIRSKGKNEKGQEVFEMQSFFILNENEASKARVQAMQNAFKESNLAQEYANKVANFVQEGFDLKSGE